MRVAQDWRAANGVVIPLQGEVIGVPLWSRKTYTSGTDTQTTFFDVVPANKRAGNLAIAGQLPAGVSFRIRAIRVVLHLPPFAIAAPAGAVNPLAAMPNDLFVFYNNGVFRLEILNKPYLEAPLYMVPPGVGIAHTSQNAGAAGSLSPIASFGEASPRAVYALAMPLVIPPQTNFTTIISFPAGAVTLANGNTDVSVVFDGEMMRPVQ